MVKISKYKKGHLVKSILEGYELFIVSDSDKNLLKIESLDKVTKDKPKLKLSIPKQFMRPLTKEEEEKYK